jgi:hypothetical protein
VHAQLSTEIIAAGGVPATVLSASKELEPGARAALLLAEGRFRLDVLIRGDALQAFVRNLTPGQLEFHGDSASPHGTTLTFGDVARYGPGRAGLGFSLSTGSDRLLAKVVIATLRFSERGTVRVTGQAIVRRTMRSG